MDTFEFDFTRLTYGDVHQAKTVVAKIEVAVKACKNAPEAPGMDVLGAMAYELDQALVALVTPISDEPPDETFRFEMNRFLLPDVREYEAQVDMWGRIRVMARVLVGKPFGVEIDPDGLEECKLNIAQWGKIVRRFLTEFAACFRPAAG